MTIILGIDPGSRATGYGIINSDGSHHQCISYGVIRVAKSTFAEQLHEIFCDLTDLLKQQPAQEVAIEQVFVMHNVSSALKLGQARGAAITAVAQFHIPVFEYSTRQVKQSIVGYGAAIKQQMQHMTKLMLNLKKVPPQDAADALAIALCHAHMRKNLMLRAKLKHQSGK